MSEVRSSDMSSVSAEIDPATLVSHWPSPKFSASYGPMEAEGTSGGPRQGMGECPPRAAAIAAVSDACRAFTACCSVLAEKSAPNGSNTGPNVRWMPASFELVRKAH
jgi:hypothetical protein